MRKVWCLLALVIMLSGTGQAYEIWTWDMLGHMPEIAVDVHNYGPRLILSDNPETTDSCGILYQDYVFGKTRLFMHHVNAAEKPAFAVAVLQNENNTDVEVEVNKSAFAGPGYDYSLIGKQTNAAYFDINRSYNILVPAHKSVVLDPRMLTTPIIKDQLVTGMYDFVVNGRLLLKTVMLPYDSDAIVFSENAGILPKEQMHPRGTFNASNRAIFFRRDYNPGQDGLCALTLADGKLDPFQTGKDAITGETVINYGNYGVVYRLFILAAEGQPFNIYLNPWGGTYGGVMGIRPGQGINWQNVAIPQNGTVFAENTIYHVEPIMQVGNDLLTQLLFTPPGASNLPVKLLFMPPDFDLQKYAAINRIKYAKQGKQ